MNNDVAVLLRLLVGPGLPLYDVGAHYALLDTAVYLLLAYGLDSSITVVLDRRQTE